MKTKIRQYFIEKAKDLTSRNGHPYYNDSVLTKVGKKYLYFTTRNGIKKEEIFDYYMRFINNG